MKYIIVSAFILTSNSAYSISEQYNKGMNEYKFLQEKTGEKKFEYPEQPVSSGKFIEKYQALNELPETGILDDLTKKYLNRTQLNNNLSVVNYMDAATWLAISEPSDAAKKEILEKALKQWKLIDDIESKKKSHRFIVVNIPSMTLYAYELINNERKLMFTSKVIIGKPTTKTPFNSFEIWAIKYNPTWTPTKNILNRGLYKNGVYNPEWIKKHGLIMASNGKYTQPAGEKNALGLLKFETTSNENIYLHDTNERHLFEKNIRAYSSGCIRVQEFKKIAEWITEDNDQHYDSEMKKPTHIRKLEESVPVYITYTLINYNYNRPVYSQDIYKLYN